MQWLVFVIALLASVILVPVVRVVARRLGKVAQPRGDRWRAHRQQRFAHQMVAVHVGQNLAQTVGYRRVHIRRGKVALQLRACEQQAHLDVGFS